MKIQVPFIIGGELVNREELIEEIKFRDKTVQIVLPEFSFSDLEKIKKTRENLDQLHSLKTEEIIDFLVKVGEKWKKGNKLRDQAVLFIQESTGYSKEMVEFSMDQIEQLLSKDYLNMLLDCELGSNKIMDEWIKRGEAYVHCQPKGTVLHILAGNAPTISIISLIRGIITKNSNILKMSSRDMVTLSYFVRTFLEIDPNHPVTKSVSVIYWKSSNQEILKDLIGISNAICVWGGGDAIDNVRKLSVGKEVLSFGPRRGVQMIGREVSFAKNIKEIAEKAAHDLSIFDQEGCFSPQICFFEGNREEAKKYALILEEALINESKKNPRGKMTLHQMATINNIKSCSIFLGHELIHSDKFDYAIIIIENIGQAKNHPLGRTLFIIPIKDLKDSFSLIGSETQVVAIEPFLRAYEFREELTRKGVDRITHLGKMPNFAAGSPHDGIYPISRLVRWVKSR